MRTPARHDLAILAFMAAVTCWVLAVLFGYAARGTLGAAETAVYGTVAGFGLAYLGSAWRALWRSPDESVRARS
jgi:hypothetical protein